MMERPFVLLRLTVWMVLLIFPDCYAQSVCDVGWFGSSCQYKCHCTYNNCDSNGDCRDGNTCVKGWFGPQCQYVDLTYTYYAYGVTKVEFIDADDTTCNDNEGQTQGTLVLNRTIPITWLRLHFLIEGLLENIEVYFTDYSTRIGSTYQCKNQRRAVVDSQTIDIYCDVDAEVDRVTYKGEAVGYLCSIYVSGGRNVALKQSQVSQSDVSYSGVASKAVDGDTDQKYNKGSCTHTTSDNKHPYWQVQFAQISDVNRYVLYNRGDCCGKRLKGFVLTSFDKNNGQVFKHTDQTPRNQSVYDITTANNTSSIKRVNIIATDSENILTMCEVQIFGDSHCPVGKYGRECDQDCHCTSNEPCFVSTGQCPSGCAAGYLGPRCNQPCKNGTYGQNCTLNCSTYCKDKLKCDNVNGTCEECAWGRDGDFCDRNCPPTHYGQRCVHKCSPNCANGTCNGTTGICFDCPPGKTGENCTLDCPPTMYGPRCIHNCSMNCVDSKCNASSGVCDQCPHGRFGDQCEEDCPPTLYGPRCVYNCSMTCLDSRCNGSSGVCEQCPPGMLGDQCEEVQSAEGSPAKVGAIVVVILAIVALVVFGVLFWRRRQSKQSERSSTMQERQPSMTAENNLYVEYVPPGTDNLYSNVQIARGSGLANIAAHAEPSQSGKSEPKPPGQAASKTGKKGEKSDLYFNTTSTSKSQSTTIAIGDLQAFVATNNMGFFKKQFENIHENKSATTKVGHSSGNKPKNRYKNICAYDHSRVRLDTGEYGEHGDYINASYIEGYKGEEQFIASQGPTKVMLDDFVRMLWEQKTEKVVMLTNLVEEGKTKCEKYWPDDDKRQFGDIKMVLSTTEVFADYTIRRLKLYKKGYPDQRLTHFHFTSWPDKGVPTIPWGLVDFEQRVASYPTDSPIVVHCSAGVGRTGTFIALRNVMRQAEDTGYVDCFATVQNLRQNRINMVQTAEQYEFLHRAAQVAMVCLGTTVTSGDIQERIAKLHSKSRSGQTHMEAEFKAVCSVCADAGESNVNQDTEADSGDCVYENSGNMANKLKDRLKNVPPKEQYRAILSCENDKVGEYINAVLVPSFRKLDQQLLTQLPLPTTVTDFWRLVTQYKVSLVVASKLDCDDRDPSIAKYLPPSQCGEMSVPLFNIKSGSISRSDVVEVQKVFVEAVDANMRKKSVPVFLSGQHRLTHVTYKGTDLNPIKLLSLIKVLREHFPGPDGRVIFMCRNGATYSGLVCVLTLLLDRMDHDLRLTVPLVVGAIKSIRPQVIATLEQYKLLYEVLHTYNEASNEYSNFGEGRSPGNYHKGMEDQHNDIYANT